MFKQATRLAQINSPLGPDVLLLKEMGGLEELGRLFEYELALESADPDIDLNRLLGQPMGLSLQLHDGSQRHFSGIVAHCSQSAPSGQFARYQVTLRPWLWLLTKTTDCRIFQNLTIPQIIDQVFKALGVNDADVENHLTRTYRQWEYCVQYRENSFAFVSRLMEQEGIYYFFRHEQGRHVLILADDYGAHAPAAGYETVPYYPPTEQQRERDHIFDWHMSRAVQSGSLEFNDYDFKNTVAELKVRSDMPRPHTAGDYPLFDYHPVTYEQSTDGEHYAQTRLESLQGLHERIELRGKARGLGAGHLFSLSGFSRKDQNREYLIVGARYQIVQESYESGTGGAGAQFESGLTCIDSRQTFRALADTPRPMVRGPQTAIVVGPENEEIWTDVYGRVKVHFHWHRHDKSDENSSCWIRVSQAWAGKNWGSIQIPRIGQEVIVSFLEGNPDQPIITGRVYNEDQSVPYDLPANATQSGMKSRSSKGGTDAHFNEIRMEDKKGAEQLYIHAEKNQDIVVENDETHSVGHNRTKSIGHNETVTVGNNRVRIVNQNDVLAVGLSKSDSISQSYVIEVGENLRLVCGASVIELNASGQINICGVQISLHASGDAQFNTGGVLHLNNGKGPDAEPEGQGVKDAIDGKVASAFPKPK